MGSRWNRASVLVALLLATLVAGAARAQTTGLIPLDDLGAGTYSGFQGGLYPGGGNSLPPTHLAAALARAAEIVPRDVLGNPAATGWIGMIAVGMSNTTHEFGAFERNADADPTRNARLVLVDTGFGGQTATAIANPAAPYWTIMNQRLAAMGLTAAQVQVAWLKEAEAQPPNNFPLHAQALRDTLKRVCNALRAKFPNLKICYLSSRIYGGYSAQGTLNPEPQAYESGFAVKWLIEDQIAGDPQLNYGQLPGDPRSPLLMWGPYLWADGVNPRSDGTVWLLSDLESDRVHPGPTGEQKVAAMLAGFFASDPTAAPWWPVQTGTRLLAIDATDDAHVSAAAPAANFGADPLLLSQGGGAPINTYARFDVSGVVGVVQLAKLSLRVSQAGGGTVQSVADAAWDESTIDYANAPAFGPALVAMPQSSRDGTIGANVTANVRADADGRVSFAITTTSAGAASYLSKEGGQPPRLVLAVADGVADVAARSASAGVRVVRPNPTSSAANITFELPRPEAVDLALFSVDGRRVRTLARGAWSAGLHEVSWDGRDARGQVAAAGVYLVRLASGSSIRTAKLVRIR